MAATTCYMSMLAARFSASNIGQDVSFGPASPSSYRPSAEPQGREEREGRHVRKGSGSLCCVGDSWTVVRGNDTRRGGS